MKIFFDIARFKFIQILVFGAVFLGVYYFTLYDDGSFLNTQIEGVQNQINQSEGKVKEKEEELRNVREFEKEILAEEDVIKHFLNFIPESLTYTDLSALLIKSAKITGVNIELKRDEETNVNTESSEYETLKIELTINGSFSQIMFFLSKLTSQRRILILKKINMQIHENRSIKANLSVLAYRYKGIEKKEDNIEKGS